MPTEKGRYQRKREEAKIAPHGTGWEQRWDRAYTDRKYLARERVSGRSHETALPETRDMPATQIKERIGTSNPASIRLIPDVPETLVPMHPCQYYPVTKRALNMPDVPPDIKRTKQTGTVYDSTVHSVRDGKRRTPIPETVTKAAKQVDSSVMRRAWKMMDQATKDFVKIKSK